MGKLRLLFTATLLLLGGCGAPEKERLGSFFPVTVDAIEVCPIVNGAYVGTGCVRPTDHFPAYRYTIKTNNPNNTLLNCPDNPCGSYRGFERLSISTYRILKKEHDRIWKEDPKFAEDCATAVLAYIPDRFKDAEDAAKKCEKLFSASALKQEIQKAMEEE